MTNYSYQVQRSEYAVDGSVITIDRQNSIEVLTGEFEITGNDATLSADQQLVATTRSFAVSGSNAVLNRSIALQALGDSNARFSITGSQLTVSTDSILKAETRIYAITGSSLQSQKIFTLQQSNDSSNNFTINGSDLTVLRAYVLELSTESFTITGRTTILRISKGILVATRGFISITGGQLRGIFDSYISLPGLRPSTREFTPAVNSFSLTRSLNGVIYRRLSTSVASAAELRLGYQNVTDQDVLDFLDLYDSCYGKYKPLDPSPETYAGAEPALQAYLRLDNTPMRWAFAAPPSVESVSVGLHNVSISLRSRIAPRLQFGGKGGGGGEFYYNDTDGGSGTGAANRSGGGGSSLFYPRPDPSEPPPLVEAIILTTGNSDITLNSNIIEQDFIYQPTSPTNGRTTTITIRNQGTPTAGGYVDLFRTYTFAYLSASSGECNYGVNYFGSPGGTNTNLFWGRLYYGSLDINTLSLIYTWNEGSCGVLTGGSGRLSGIAGTEFHGHPFIGSLVIYYADVTLNAVWN